MEAHVVIERKSSVCERLHVRRGAQPVRAVAQLLAPPGSPELRHSLVEGEVHTAHVLAKEPDHVDAVLRRRRLTGIEERYPRHAGPVAFPRDHRTRSCGCLC
jgi:hypothetical protein